MTAKGLIKSTNLEYHDEQKSFLIETQPNGEKLLVVRLVTPTQKLAFQPDELNALLKIARLVIKKPDKSEPKKESTEVKPGSVSKKG